jgi:aminoglycoside phosphotransferase (APT) family kinase protein
VIALDDERLVLKRYPVGAVVEREWQAMNIAYQHGLPTPRPIAVDPDGAWFGYPALAMTLVRGRPMLNPTDRDGFAGHVADVLAAMHELRLTSLPRALRRPHGIDTLDLTAIPAEGHLPPATIEQIKVCLDGLLSSMAAAPRVFTHGDFHPGNLVWHKERLAGVVDWSNTRPGSRWSELAYFRVELSVLVDVRLANQILRKYEHAIGQHSPMQPAWDLLHVLSGHTWMHSWLTAYREQGRPDLDVARGRERLRRLAASLLAKLDT